MPKGYMGYTIWQRMSAEQQMQYLKETNQEVAGYTLVGQSQIPQSIEFRPTQQSNSTGEKSDV